jgi:hypothetical protein
VDTGAEASFLFRADLKGRRELLTAMAAISLKVLRDVLGSIPAAERSPPSALDRRRHAEVFDLCAAFHFGVVPWARMPEPFPLRALGKRRPDDGSVCCSLDFSRCLLAKWHTENTASLTWRQVSTAYALAVAAGAQGLVVAVGAGVEVHPRAAQLMRALPIQVESVADERIDEVCALALALA